MGITTRIAIYIGENNMFNQWIWTHSIQFISDKLISKPYIYIHFNQKQYKEQLPSIDMLHYVTQQ